ncbi:MAG TPA: HAD family hydrolase [Acidimicrobiales bacterium]|jgi:phosphonatase-like hydrolase|nr:HAD family hydrolase [Acidimicrobiales bacterium]
MTVELICFDMAGTTVNDHGLVLTAFRRTIDELGLSPEEAHHAESYVIETMGQSKIEVFTVLFDDRAHAANEAFESHFVEAANDVGVSEVPGARDVAERARGLGITVALTTGFSPTTREALIDLLGWNELFPFRVSPADAGRGRPHPDMVLLCALRAQVSAVKSIMVVGDTASDMRAGRRAGAGQCVGVLSGTDSAARLLQSGADNILDSVADLELGDSFVAQ